MTAITKLPGETDEQFDRRVVDSAPSLTPEVAARLAALLIPSRALGPRTADRR